MAGIKNLPVYASGAGVNYARRPTPATVYPKTGGAYTGYVIDGRTYKDPQGSTRIDDGSRVELSDGRTYIYNRAAGGVADLATAANGYEGALGKYLSDYRAAGAYNDNAVDAAVKKSVYDLNRQKQQVEADTRAAESAAKAAYIQASDPYGPIGQRLEALGLGDSGYAESTYARLGGDYQAALADARSSRSAALSEIDAAINRAYLDGEIQKAQAWRELERDIMKYAAEGSKSLADFRFKAAQQVLDDEHKAAELEAELEKELYTRQRNAQTDAEKAKTTAFNQALSMVKLGVSSAEIAEALGISKKQADAIAYRAIAPKTKARSTSSSAASTKKKADEAKASSNVKLTGDEKKAAVAQEYEKLNDLINWYYSLIRDEGITDPTERLRLFDKMIVEKINHDLIPAHTVLNMFKVDGG